MRRSASSSPAANHVGPLSSWNKASQWYRYIGTRAPSRKEARTTRLSRRAYANQAIAIATASSDVAKTGPGTLPTYSVVGLMKTSAACGPKYWCQIQIGSAAALPVTALTYANGAPLVTIATIAYAKSPDCARIAGA